MQFQTAQQFDSIILHAKTHADMIQEAGGFRVVHFPGADEFISLRIGSLVVFLSVEQAKLIRGAIDAAIPESEEGDISAGSPQAVAEVLERENVQQPA